MTLDGPLRSLPLISILFACGCQAAATPQQTAAPDLPPAGPDETYTVDFPEPTDATADRYISIDLGPDQSLRCADVTPRFAFDEANPKAQARPELRAIAKCLNKPAFVDKSVVLIGHADARGTDDYNAALGMRRAKAIRGMLIEYGVDAERVRLRTEGESQALGNQPAYAHGYDRRVVIDVEATPHAP